MEILKKIDKKIWLSAAAGVAIIGAAGVIYKYFSMKKIPAMGDYTEKNFLVSPEMTELTNKILEDNMSKYDTKEHYKRMLSLVDYTTLDVADTIEKVENMVETLNTFEEKHPDVPPMAAICVYPPFVAQIRKTLKNKKVKIAAVSAGFPASQTSLEVKILETKYALRSGADEIDIVLSVGKFLEKRYAECFEEIYRLKQACGSKKLKVILEVDSLKDLNAIYNASMLAMDAGADFIKTSTGKVTRDEKNYETTIKIMCEAIKDYEHKTKRKVSIKPAGGIRNEAQALRVYTLISEVLGEEYQNNKMFRIGASSLADNLIKKIEKLE